MEHGAGRFGLELLIEPRYLLGSDDLNVWSIESKFEPDLIVREAMDGQGTFEQRHSRIASLYGRETQLFHELVVEVLDVAFLCTDCAFSGGFEVLLCMKQTTSYPSINHATAEMSASYISQASCLMLVR